jgi:NADH:ubiquinone oxidoreductase subunit E
MASRAPAKSPPKYKYRGDSLADPPPPELTSILDRYRDQPDALITVLEEIQRHYGYLPQRQLQYAARGLGFPLSRVYGVAKFYNFFQFEPPGRHLVHVCQGTACHVSHSDAILQHIKDELGISEGETTSDRLFTLQRVACVGACSLAPVVVIDEHTYARMTPEKTWENLASLRAQASDEDEEESH